MLLKRISNNLKVKEIRKKSQKTENFWKFSHLLPDVTVSSTLQTVVVPTTMTYKMAGPKFFVIQLEKTMTSELWRNSREKPKRRTNGLTSRTFPAKTNVASYNNKSDGSLFIRNWIARYRHHSPQGAFGPVEEGGRTGRTPPPITPKKSFSLNSNWSFYTLLVVES